MLRRPLFKEFFIFLIVIGSLNYLADQFNWYWSFIPFDSFMHFLGGLWVVLFFMWFYFYSGLFAPRKRNLSQFLIVAILGLIFVAVTWEIYELILGEASFNRAGYAWDTTMDLMMDMLGGLAACFYAYLKELKYYAN